ncbi:hypothetical protein QYE76_050616 [Lolium multiflorum]|uniref:Uncharacterized protein n=1 Tax=Lolium multiflorum TaxID=4521 RepID=A0AAD8SQA7_LOLMU|nr:hypothetical protein QYE76_050616 [Lolium multiflorum]
MSMATAPASWPLQAAMAAADVDRHVLPLFLRPVLLHGVGAAAHLLLAVAGRLIFAAGIHPRKEPAAAATRGAGFRWFRLAVRATWVLAASEVFFAAYSLLSCFLDGGTGWGEPDAVTDQADALSRAVAWLMLAAYLQLEYGRRGEDRFPAPLRLWWALFLLLSVLAVAVHAATGLQYKLPCLRAPGRETPASENHTVDASMFTGAGFLSVLTFSWMGPLFAVGHSKTLDLDDVPDLDRGDSVAGLLPPFKATAWTGFF